MKNKKLGIALLTFAVFANIHAESEKRSRKGLYQPASADTLVIIPGVEDAVVGAGSTVAEIVTLGHANTGNAPTGLVVAVPDLLPGVAKARKDSNSEESCPRKQKTKSTKECKAKKEKPAKVKKEKSCKKSCDSTTKKTKTKKQKSNDGHPAEAVVLPVTVAADVVTLDTQHFTHQTVDSINGDSDTEHAAE